jgi:hypothetical protein
MPRPPTPSSHTAPPHPPRLSTAPIHPPPTLCGRPNAGLYAQRRSITSRSRSFCPLYVVRMDILDAG